MRSLRWIAAGGLCTGVYLAGCTTGPEGALPVVASTEQSQTVSPGESEQWSPTRLFLQTLDGTVALDTTTRALVQYSGARGATLTITPSTLQLGKPNPTMVPRSDAALAYMPNIKRMILFGGRVSSTGAPSSETWQWDGSSWAPVLTPTSPPPRTGASMVYDPARKRLLLVGGIGAGAGYGPRYDTWSFDGVGWTDESSQAGTPPVVYGTNALLYDEKHGGPALVTGGNLGCTPGRIWRYDTGTWVVDPASAVSPPFICGSGPAAYDPTTGDIATITSYPSLQFWTFRAGTWINKDVSGLQPGSYYSAQMAYWQGAVTVLGGIFGQTGVARRDLQRWDGQTWSQFPNSVAPPATGVVGWAWTGATRCWTTA